MVVEVLEVHGAPFHHPARHPARFRAARQLVLKGVDILVRNRAKEAFAEDDRVIAVEPDVFLYHEYPDRLLSHQAVAFGEVPDDARELPQEGIVHSGREFPLEVDGHAGDGLPGHRCARLRVQWDVDVPVQGFSVDPPGQFAVAGEVDGPQVRQVLQLFGDFAGQLVVGEVEGLQVQKAAQLFRNAAVEAAPREVDPRDAVLVHGDPVPARDRLLDAPVETPRPRQRVHPRQQRLAIADEPRLRARHGHGDAVRAGRKRNLQGDVAVAVGSPAAQPAHVEAIGPHRFP